MSYFLALVCWTCDIHFCEFLTPSAERAIPLNPQLHAWWHVLVSIGLYLLTVCTSHARLRVLAAARNAELAARGAEPSSVATIEYARDRGSLSISARFYL